MTRTLISLSLCKREIRESSGVLNKEVKIQQSIIPFLQLLLVFISHLSNFWEAAVDQSPAFSHNESPFPRAARIILAQGIFLWQNLPSLFRQ